MNARLQWTIKLASGEERGPLNESDLIAMIQADPTQFSFVRQGESAWHPVEAFIKRLEELKNQGIYLRNAEREYGPFTLAKAQQILSHANAQMLQYKVGSHSPWQDLPSNPKQLVPPPLPDRVVHKRPPPLPPFRNHSFNSTTAMVGSDLAPSELDENHDDYVGFMPSTHTLVALGLLSVGIGLTLIAWDVWGVRYLKLKPLGIVPQRLLDAVSLRDPRPSNRELRHNETEARSSADQLLTKATNYSIPQAAERLADKILESDLKAAQVDAILQESAELDKLWDRFQESMIPELVSACRQTIGKNNYHLETFPTQLSKLPELSDKLASASQAMARLRTMLSQMEYGDLEAEPDELLSLIEEVSRHNQTLWELEKLNPPQLQYEMSEISGLQTQLANLDKKTKQLKASRQQVVDAYRRRKETIDGDLKKLVHDGAKLMRELNHTAKGIETSNCRKILGAPPQLEKIPKPSDISGRSFYEVTYRVEGNFYYSGNKVFEIPPEARSSYVIGDERTEVSPNKKIVSGIFRFQGNLNGAWTGSPIEKYIVPDEMLEYLKNKSTYEALEEINRIRKDGYEQACRVLDDKLQAIQGMLDHLSLLAGGTVSPQEHYQYLQQLTFHASKLSKKPQPELSADPTDTKKMTDSLKSWFAEIQQPTKTEPAPSPVAEKQSAPPQPETPGAPQPQLPVVKNYLLNGDFEQDGNACRVPKHWFHRTSGDQNAASVASIGSGFCLNHFFWKPYTAYTGQKVQLANGTYRLTLKVNSSGGQKVAHAVVTGYGGPMKRTTEFLKGGDWQTYTIDQIEVTTGRCEVGVVSNAAANQWLNVDHVVLEATGQ